MQPIIMYMYKVGTHIGGTSSRKCGTHTHHTITETWRERERRTGRLTLVDVDVLSESLVLLEIVKEVGVILLVRLSLRLHQHLSIQLLQAPVPLAMSLTTVTVALFYQHLGEGGVSQWGKRGERGEEEE